MIIWYIKINFIFSVATRKFKITYVALFLLCSIPTAHSEANFFSTTLIASYYHEMILLVEAITNIYYFTKCFHISASFSIKSKSCSSAFHSPNHWVPTCVFLSSIPSFLPSSFFPSILLSFFPSCSRYATSTLLLLCTLYSQHLACHILPIHALAFPVLCL